MANNKNQKSMTVFKFSSIFLGSLITIWSSAAILSGLAQANWQVSELLRQYLIAVGLMQEFHTLSDFYAHISLQEGLPIAILEAMALKKPVMATAIGGIPEAIRHEENGLLVEANAQKISEAMIMLNNDKEMAARFVEIGLKVIGETFNWNRAVDEFLELYEV